MTSRFARGRWIQVARTIALIALAHVILLILSRSTGEVGFVASFGASLVLLLGAPDSPLGSAYRACVGNVGSAVVGVLVWELVGSHDPDLAAVLAVSGAVGWMVAVDAVHPPGGATALLVAVGGDEIRAAGLWFALHPIGTGTLALIAYRALVRRWAPQLLGTGQGGS